MSWQSPVVWSQGMFLQPHHFQQEARWVARLVDARARCLSPHAWGFDELVLDASLLKRGLLGIERASGTLPDGTPFVIPSLDPKPEPLRIDTELRSEAIHLALPLSREGTAEVEIGEAAFADTMRLQAAVRETRDHTSLSEDAEPIQVGRFKLRLVRDRDLSDAVASLGVAWVEQRRDDGEVELDHAYIPPAVTLDATEPLAAFARLLHALVVQRGQALAARMGQLSGGVSELADFLMLQVLNRAEPLLHEHVRSPSSHPQALFVDCLGLAGELSTFADARRPATWPAYRHDDLRGCFTPLIDALRALLTIVIDQLVHRIELVDHKQGVFTAVVRDMALLRSASFVLAVNAQMPVELLRQRFVNQCKVGPFDRIRTLVSRALPGIGLTPLSTVPRQLPYHAGYFYWQLERGGELWQQFESTGSLAMHVAGDFPGLELELWAIRSPGKT